MVYNVKINSFSSFFRGKKGMPKFDGPGCNLPSGVPYRDVVGTMKLATNIDQQ
jgi:hypothetical protein